MTPEAKKRYGDPALTVRMPADLIQRLKHTARRYNSTVSHLLRLAAEQVLINIDEADKRQRRERAAQAQK